DDRDACATRCEIRGRRGVAAESDNDVDVVLSDHRDDLGHCLPEPRPEAQRAAIDPSWERELRDGQEFVTAFGNEPGLQPLLRSEDEDLRVGLTLGDGVRDGQERIDVTGGTAAGEKVRGHDWNRPSARALRGEDCSLAKASTIPMAASDVKRAVPPAEMNGSGTPSTGSRRRTTPMLMNAWPTIQTRIAPVVMRTKGSELAR